MQPTGEVLCKYLHTLQALSFRGHEGLAARGSTPAVASEAILEPIQVVTRCATILSLETTITCKQCRGASKHIPPASREHARPSNLFSLALATEHGRQVTATLPSRVRNGQVAICSCLPRLEFR